MRFLSFLFFTSSFFNSDHTLKISFLEHLGSGIISWVSIGPRILSRKSTIIHNNGKGGGC